MFAAFKSLDIAVKAGIIFLLVLFVAGMVIAANHFIDGAFVASEQKGAATVRVEVAEKGMMNVQNANAAAAEVAADPVVRNADCLRDSRTPENC